MSVTMTIATAARIFRNSIMRFTDQRMRDQ
jgi:hypothetical protein